MKEHIFIVLTPVAKYEYDPQYIAAYRHRVTGNSLLTIGRPRIAQRDDRLLYIGKENARQAIIDVVDDVATLIDLGNEPRTHVNGLAVTKKCLASGDVIHVRSAKILYLVGTANAANPSPIYMDRLTSYSFSEITNNTLSAGVFDGDTQQRVRQFAAAHNSVLNVAPLPHEDVFGDVDVQSPSDPKSLWRDPLLAPRCSHKKAPAVLAQDIRVMFGKGTISTNEATLARLMQLSAEYGQLPASKRKAKLDIISGILLAIGVQPESILSSEALGK